MGSVDHLGQKLLREGAMIVTGRYDDETKRWWAVIERDREADGFFVYGGRTTGVYCRPWCRSRRPNRENVQFFSNPLEAEGAGYRACRKCRPSESELARPAIPEVITRACRLIERAENPPTLDRLAELVGLGPHALHRLFTKTLGITPKGYASSRRAGRFRQHLREDLSVTSAIYRAGYATSSRCYEEVDDQLGMTPTRYRNGGEGETIQLTVVACDLGFVAIASTRRGLCLIEIGEDPEKLHEQVHTRFSKARLQEADATFLHLVTRVVEGITIPSQASSLPLDIRGTVFQRKVWEALRAIPPGQTATYSEVAEAIGQPSASRAVARACATNPVAIAIPCHRVVRKNGDLSGYRWGVDRKRALLEREAANAGDDKEESG